MTGGLSELGPEKILTVHEMDAFSFTEGLFQLFVSGFPRYHLGVGAREVSIDYDLSSIGDEHFADVWEAEFLFVRSR